VENFSSLRLHAVKMAHFSRNSKKTLELSHISICVKIQKSGDGKLFVIDFNLTLEDSKISYSK
jgi:hypothetical protein